MIDADALNFEFRRHSAAVLAFDDLIERVRFVVGHGVLLMPLRIRLAPSPQHLSLLIPDEHDSSLQLHAEAAVITDNPLHLALLDRWQAYHGRPSAPQIIIARPLGAKLQGTVFNHDALECVNTIAPLEPRALKRLNAERASLAELSTKIFGPAEHDPVAVGIDSRGIDLRTRTGLRRSSFTRTINNEHDLSAAIDAIINRITDGIFRS